MEDTPVYNTDSPSHWITERNKAYSDLELARKELESAKSNASMYYNQLKDVRKELSEMHEFLDTFESSLKTECEYNRKSLAIRLTSMLVKEFKWIGK